MLFWLKIPISEVTMDGAELSISRLVGSIPTHLTKRQHIGDDHA